MATQLPDGVRLLRTLTGHRRLIGRIGWSPDGRLLATPSNDGTVRVWDAASGDCVRIVRGRHLDVIAAAFDPDGGILATGGNGGTELWDVESWELRTTLDSGIICNAVAFSPRDRILATASNLSGVTLWQWGHSPCAVPHRFALHSAFFVAFDAEGGMFATGSADDVMLWEIPSGQLRPLRGHAEQVLAVAFHPNSEILASASFGRTIRLWDVATGNTVLILEGHTGRVQSLSFSRDGRVLASKSGDGTVRLWETESGKCCAVLPALASKDRMPSVAFHPHLPILAAVGSDAEPLTLEDSAVYLWELDVDRLLARPATHSVAYTTAKIVLVGEPGVGKTGLGWRLAHRKFVEHSSTHRQQFWLLDELSSTGADGTERETILWDLAGQPDYRLIHALYLDDADLALVLFDPTRDDDPLRGVEYWLRQLGHDRPIILVAARSDVGASRLTTEEIEAFCADRGIAGYVATSAFRGDGLDELVERMRAAIRWDQRPTTVTTQTFNASRITSWNSRRRRAEDTILSAAELRARLDREIASAEFTDAELLTAVQHLSNHGYVAQLRTSRGEPRILLAPVLLNNLAASMVLEARRNPKGLGSLEEQQVLASGYHFPELEALSAEERKVCSTRPLRHSWRTRSASVKPTR